MRLLLLFSVSLLLAVPGWAQERVRNVRIQVVDGERLEILYDMITARPGDSVYVEVHSRGRGDLRLLPQFVRGDVGERLTAGSNKRIVWEAIANGYSLNEDVQATVFVKTGLVPVRSPVAQAAPVAGQPSPLATAPVAVTLTPPRSRRIKAPKSARLATDSVAAEPESAQPTTPLPQDQVPPNPPMMQPAEPARIMTADTLPVRKIRYAGQAWAFLSAVAPGVGNIFVQTPRPKIGLRPLVAVSCYGLLAYGLTERQKAQEQYTLYEGQKNSAAGEPYYQTANEHHHQYFLATRGALVVAAADVILTFFKGLHNSQFQQQARRFQSVTLRPGLLAGQPTAVVRFSF